MTAAATRLPSPIAFTTASGSGPLLPMHVVQPYAATLNPSCSRNGSVPDSRRYSVTTLEPGARLVFTNGLTRKPRATAFLASKPAPSITLGLLVLVQEVMAAITTAPCPKFWGAAALLPASTSGTLRFDSAAASPKPRSLTGAVSAARKLRCTSASATRSCGRLGPASEGSTLARSSASVSVNTGSGVLALRNSACSLA